MDKELLWKEQLIETLKSENEQLKNEIVKFKEREERLEAKIAGLEASVAIGRRGMPWT
tara:strand:+ start:124 stop:297 length:174 start_codon:yes stop_codon:yes gene_type:complete